MTHTLVYPITAAHNSAGHLEIGGCDVVELVGLRQLAPGQLDPLVDLARALGRALAHDAGLGR